MHPLLNMLVKNVTAAPGFQETIVRINTFISTVDLRLASLQENLDAAHEKLDRIESELQLKKTRSE